MNGQTDVTSNTSSYFTIVSDGNRRVIMPKGNTNYSINIAGNISGGTVTTDMTTAKPGDYVTLTTNPASGKRLESLTVQGSNGNIPIVSGNRFVMPKSNVTISATFVESTVVLNNGVLTLSGNVNADEVKTFKNENVTSVVCESGTVLPENCSGLFKEFEDVITIDLSNADVSNVRYAEEMFYCCYELTTIYVSRTWSLDVDDYGESMFLGCERLVGGCGTSYHDVHMDDVSLAKIDCLQGSGYLSEKD